MHSNVVYTHNLALQAPQLQWNAWLQLICILSGPTALKAMRSENGTNQLDCFVYIN